MFRCRINAVIKPVVSMAMLFAFILFSFMSTALASNNVDQISEEHIDMPSKCESCLVLCRETEAKLVSLNLKMVR